MLYKVDTHASSAKGKRAAVIILAVAAMAILASGVTFTVYSLATDLTIPVFGTQMPGMVFGLAMAYLGFRYIQSVRKLRLELAQSTEAFSWQNFRKTEK
jgi:hypothetical protein